MPRRTRLHNPHLDYAVRLFGFDVDADPPMPVACELPIPGRGEILAVTGPSGAGKSLALRRLLSAHGGAGLPGFSPELPVLELFSPHLPTERVLRTLARVGLADAGLWQRKAAYLSAGEQARLRLALALVRDWETRESAGGPLLVVDEYDAHLDATTARIIATCLHRVVVREGLRLVVSTHRPETLAYLRPARVVRVNDGFAQTIATPAPADLCEEITLTRGRVRDYAHFARWHYLGPGRPGPTSDVFLARHEGRAVAIAMFGYPHLLLAARSASLPAFAPSCIVKTGARGLNLNVRLLQRVVVEPRYRGIGVALKLIQHGLASLDVPYVECVAQMGGICDFLTGAGFVRECDMPVPPSVLRLRRYLELRGLGVRDLLREGGVTADVASLVSAVTRSRVQTGFGSRRSVGDLPPAAVRKALLRLEARPVYFLWRRHATG